MTRTKLVHPWYTADEAENPVLGKSTCGIRRLGDRAPIGLPSHPLRQPPPKQVSDLTSAPQGPATSRVLGRKAPICLAMMPYQSSFHGAGRRQVSARTALGGVSLL